MHVGPRALQLAEHLADFETGGIAERPALLLLSPFGPAVEYLAVIAIEKEHVEHALEGKRHVLPVTGLVQRTLSPVSGYASSMFRQCA